MRVHIILNLNVIESSVLLQIFAHFKINNKIYLDQTQHVAESSHKFPSSFVKSACRKLSHQDMAIQIKQPSTLGLLMLQIIRAKSKYGTI